MKLAELLLDTPAHLGEGAIWHDGKLLWVDIEQARVHRYDPATGKNETRDVGARVGTVVPRASGGLVIATQNGIATVDCTGDSLEGEITYHADPEQDLDGNRMNDGKCDPAGRLLVGSMPLRIDETTTGHGNLWRIDPDFSFAKLLDDVTISNGLCWSEDHETLYYIDTVTRRIDALDYDIDTGSVSNRRPHAEMPEGIGSPDGMTIDADGHLWVAMWGGSRVTRWSGKTGELLSEVNVPAKNVTSVAFGGPDLATLYITTAGGHNRDAQDGPGTLAGSLFVAHPEGVTGIPAFPFAG